MRVFGCPFRTWTAFNHRNFPTWILNITASCLWFCRHLQNYFIPFFKIWIKKRLLFGKRMYWIDSGHDCGRLSTEIEPFYLNKFPFKWFSFWEAATALKTNYHLRACKFETRFLSPIIHRINKILSLRPSSPPTSVSLLKKVQMRIRLLHWEKKIRPCQKPL